MKKIENYIDKKTEEVLSSEKYQQLEEEDRKELDEKISIHLERLVIETFINRLSEGEAANLNETLENDREKGYEKINQLISNTPELAEAIEDRIETEVEKFKNLA